MKNQKLTIAVIKSKVRPPVSQSELIDAMVELKFKEYQSNAEAMSTKEKDAMHALETAAKAYVFDYAKKLQPSVRLDYQDNVSVTFSIPASKLSEAKTYLNVKGSLPRMFDRSKCKEEIKQQIHSERMKSILKDPEIVSRLSSVLLSLGAISV